MRIDTKYDIGEHVYLKTDIDQKQRMIVEINIKPLGLVYRLMCGVEGIWHYDIEFTKEKNVLMSVQ